MKQIRLKDSCYIITACDKDCPIYNDRNWVCNLNQELYQERGVDIPLDCPLEDYSEGSK